MKKTMLLIALALLTACSTETTNTEATTESVVTEVTVTEAVTEEVTEAVTEADKENYKLGETWTVDGLFSLTITDIEVTDERNPYSEKDPAQVVRITYDYENIGYEGDIQDLFLVPDRVIDATGEMGTTYPIDTNPPTPTPIGAKMTGAQEAFGLNNESDVIKVLFETYDQNLNNHKATFEIEIPQ